MLLKVSALLLGIVVLYLLLKAAGKAQTKKVNELLDRFRDKKVLAVYKGANFFGQESLGHAQVRGNGTLIVTDREMYFEMWLPQRSFSIPVPSVTSIETPKSFLGKSKGRPLLKVLFTNENGTQDSMAWLVRDTAGAVELLQNLILR